MMNFEEFKDQVAENILGHFPEEFQEAEVRIERRVKNNDTVHEGITIHKQDEAISPMIYLEGYFEEYKNGANLDELMDQMTTQYLHHQLESRDMNVSGIMDYDSIKDKITCRLVSFENNQERLANAPHKMVSDLAVSYHIVINVNEEGIGSVMIDNSMMERYGVTVDDLHEQAIANMPTMNPVVFKPLSETMLEVMVPDFMAEHPELSEDQAREMLEEMIPHDGPEPYVLTCENKINGASELIVPAVREMVAEKIGGDYFILPSSIHETLILPKNNAMEVDELVAMVQEVNSTMVQQEEILSDHVYEYDAKKQEIVRADKVQEQSHEQSQEKQQEQEKSHDQGKEQDAPEQEVEQKHSKKK